MPSVSVGKIALQKKKSEKWQAKQAEKEKAQQKQIDEWFEKFDENGNDQLERDELRALLIHLYPGRIPTEDALNFLIKKATEIDTFSIKIAGNETGSVSREAARTTVKRYRDYFREQEYIDKVLDQYDADKSGTIYQQELLALLQALIPEANADERDVEFMIEHCDQDGDGVFSRDELVPMLGVWYQMGAYRPSASALAMFTADANVGGITGTDEEVGAVTTMQAAIRGRAQRKHLEQQAKEQEEAKAAVAMQAAMRGKATRAAVAKQKSEGLTPRQMSDSQKEKGGASPNLATSGPPPHQQSSRQAPPEPPKKSAACTIL